ncbi:class I SAM-dependent methyltransferase [Vibrio agarivorans]|uniref:class I SAM-dependent methyltransferase n=1 Tax=Vibrio agarivorans TaxID=153622 RepID=UPI0025B39C5C|nr:DUF4942 domain-containing protein [Vibrio agarivorans]MDN3661130.1 DUF4942 domain-containing protein [Vibrio agarivorans]
MNTQTMVNLLKEQQQDFQWYPTSQRMIDVVHQDLCSLLSVRSDEQLACSVLDVGAGNGSFLHGLGKGKKYAIEKAKPLLAELKKDVFVVGTDFHSQTLIDKRVDVVVSNPPYCEFIAWAEKIILEANSPLLYLIIPKRWEDSEAIAHAIKKRHAKVTILQETDFLDAERQARAQVHILRIELGSWRWHRSTNSPRVDPFKLWFDEHFPLNVNKNKVSDWAQKESEQRSLEREFADSKELILDRGLAHVLNEWYQRDLDKLMKNYSALNDINPDILQELDVNLDALCEALRMKISNLKDKYWRKLIDGLDIITDKLCSSTRQRLLDTLFERTNVDFTIDNSTAVVLWVLKNANAYYDDQLIAMVENMTELANINSYVSNQKTFGEENWRYCSRWDFNRKLESHKYALKLEYRIVVERTGGIGNEKHGLTGRSTDFLNDLLIIAHNLNYDTTSTDRAEQREWQSNKPQVFTYFNHTLGKRIELMKVRAFMNGNLHIHFNQDFLCQLNVEFGRLKGWLKSANEATAELDIPTETAQRFFSSNLQLKGSHLSLLAAA